MTLYKKMLQWDNLENNHKCVLGVHGVYTL